MIQNMSKTDCLICERIQLIKQGRNSHFVKELKTGYVVLGDSQYFIGYTLFLAKKHKAELHELSKKEQLLFLTEMAQVAKAVFKAFHADKLNYELLGNSDPHLHWHLFPRRASEPLANKPIWLVPKEVRDSTILTSEGMETLKEELRGALS